MAEVGIEGGGSVAAEGLVTPEGNAGGAAEDANANANATPIVPRGNALRLRGGVTAAVGALGAFLLMAHDAQWRLGVPVGALFIAVSTWGLMDMLGAFDDPDERVAASMTLRALAPSLGRATAGMFAFAGALWGAQASVGPQWLWGFLVTATFLGWVATVFALGVRLGPWARDEDGRERSLWRRHGFWVLAAGALLYLPTMGIYSLWDPWETHYGEVAREVLARDDWISLWWSYQGWFYSKPVLDFWIQAIAMATLGTQYKSDQMLLDPSGHPTLHPEWVVRAPNVLLTLGGMYVIYKGVAHVAGRRAGLLGALVLATMPGWFLLAHQTMTDMPCVAPMTAAMGLLLIGAYTDETALARVYEVKTGKIAWRLSAWHLVFGMFLLVAVPQILYLFSRNLELVLNGTGPHGFRVHWDEFFGGSRGNCGLPGDDGCVLNTPNALPKSLASHPDGIGAAMTHLFGGFEPVVQATLWSAIVGFVLYLNWGERRVQRLLYIAAWTLAAIATMAKGPMGLVIPGMGAFAWACTQRRWRELLRFETVSGLAISAALILPWFIAAYIRHGSAFTDELIFHDMISRAASHVHDTNEGDDTSIRYYIWQLGYALFPWTALTPLGLMAWLKGRDGSAKSDARNDAAVFLVMWFLFAFALFTFMGTKFHHYLLPAVPPVAMLIGLTLDGILPRTGEARSTSASRHDDVMFGAAALAGGLLLLLVGRDLVIKPDGADQPGAIRLLHLFTYQYRRPWPDSLDFSTALTVFTVLGALTAVGIASWRWRRQAVYAFGAVAFAWAIWGLDVYMIQTAPHWGQREVIAAYYERRSSPDELLVAYQMNWKGENFYSGNHIPVFVSTGAPFTNWMKAQRDKGTKVLFFITEHSRVGGLKSEVKAKRYEELTDKTLNNKFIVVRAEL